MSSDKILLKKGPLKTFLFFLGFSAIIWIFMQFSKDYTEVMKLPITYVNVPKDKILLDSKPETLQIRIKDKGFNLALHKIMPPRLKIDLNEAVEKKDKLVYDLQQQKQAILSQLDLDYENASFLQPSLNIDFQQSAVKTLKVVSRLQFSYAVGYSALSPVKLEPDSEKVSGPKKILDTLSEIPTAPLRVTNISKDIKGSVDLDTAG
ncbi:MAG: YbbR-like domain-containing protein, partial [Gillisia sp.]